MGTNQTQTPKGGGFFGAIERVGNKIPDPVMLFVYLIGLLIVATALMSMANVSVVHPMTKQVIVIKSLVSRDALGWFMTSMVKNFAEFPVLGLVMVISLGIGVVEKTGLMETLVKSFVAKIPKSAVTFSILFICFFSHLASDVAFIIMPPVAAMIFYSLGRHPLAGFATAVAGVGAGFTANIFIVTTDVLLSGISTQAAQVVRPGMIVSPLDNWFFMATSVFFLCAIATPITEKIVEPRLGTYKGSKAINLEEITKVDKKALKWTGIAALLFVIVIVLMVVPQGALLRDPKTDAIYGSPFLKGIVPILFFFFMTVGLTFGIVKGNIKNAKHVSQMMGDAIKQLSGFIVLVFAIAQFTAAFTWANLGQFIAISGADFLRSVNMTGMSAILAFLLLSSFTAMFIASGSALWALLAPMFLPMFMMLDYQPAFIQLVFRIGMSVVIPLIPTSPFLPIFLKTMSEYDENAGIGTYMSLMIPYTAAFLVIWPLMMVAWYYLGLPIGPGIYPHAN